LAWVDSDDYWLPGKLHAQLTYLEEHPDCRIVFTNFANFLIENEESNFNLKDYRYWLTTALMKKEVFDECGNFELSMICGSDFDIIMRMMALGIDVNAHIDHVYYRRRIHGKNSTIILKNSIMSPGAILAKNLRRKITKDR
jgi:hypothetical protein